MKERHPVVFSPFIQTHSIPSALPGRRNQGSRSEGLGPADECCDTSEAVPLRFVSGEAVHAKML